MTQESLLVQPADLHVGDVIEGSWGSKKPDISSGRSHFTPWSHYTVELDGGRYDRAFWLRAYADSWLQVIRTVGVIATALNYGTAPPVAKRVMKQWPHDCPKCKGRECAIQLATTWDCRNGCWK